MKVIPRSASAWLVWEFYTTDPDTRQPANADSLPTVAMVWTDGSSSGEFTSGVECTWSVVNVAVGVYRLFVDLSTASAPLTLGQYVTPRVRAVVNEVVGYDSGPEWCVGAPRGYGVVVADGSNSATAFKAAFSPAADSTDSLKRCWIAFISGSLKGQVAKVSAYNATTDFVTVDGGFTAAPSAGDDFEVIYR